jgi:hypothetical protein
MLTMLSGIINVTSPIAFVGLTKNKPHRSILTAITITYSLSHQLGDLVVKPYPCRPMVLPIVLMILAMIHQTDV